eukprot:scaffold31774_cov45-Phaeocystis_antarctica.AAC.1
MHARRAAHGLDDERGRGHGGLVRGEDGGGQVARDRLRGEDLVGGELRQIQRDGARVVPVHVGVQQRGAHHGVPAVRLGLRGDDPCQQLLGGGATRGHAEGLEPRVDAEDEADAGRVEVPHAGLAERGGGGGGGGGGGRHCGGPGVGEHAQRGAPHVGLG